MGYIALSSVSWITPPSSPKVCTVKHRLTSAPDISASYTTDTNALTIAADGTISPVYNITGLADETSYTVKINSNCGGAAAVATFITGTVCPDVSGITGAGNAGAP